MRTDITHAGKTLPASPAATGQTSARQPRPASCQGAMSLQGNGSLGNQSYPQKLVQLVGHRDPDLLLAAWGTPPQRAAG